MRKQKDFNNHGFDGDMSKRCRDAFNNDKLILLQTAKKILKNKGITIKKNELLRALYMPNSYEWHHVLTRSGNLSELYFFNKNEVENLKKEDVDRVKEMLAREAAEIEDSKKSKTHKIKYTITERINRYSYNYKDVEETCEVIGCWAHTKNGRKRVFKIID